MWERETKGEMVVPYLNFSQQVKSELVRVQPSHAECKQAELFGLIQSAGALHIGTKGPSIEIKTENAGLARKTVSYFRELSQSTTELIVEKETKLKKHNLYRVRLRVPLENDVLSETVINNILNKQVPQLSNECCKRSYMRGLFLGSGSIQHPEKAYHLEIRLSSKSFARRAQAFLESADLNFGLTERRNDYLLYLKDAESVAVFLTMVGAHRSLLEMENIRIIKDMKNNVNRLVNCEDANIDKTVTASLNQLKAIEILEEHGVLKKMPRTIQDVAEVRKENFDASYAKIGDILGISKSAVSYRLKKIEKEAEKITNDSRKEETYEE